MIRLSAAFLAGALTASIFFVLFGSTSFDRVGEVLVMESQDQGSLASDLSVMPAQNDALTNQSERTQSQTDSIDPEADDGSIVSMSETPLSQPLDTDAPSASASTLQAFGAEAEAADSQPPEVRQPSVIEPIPFPDEMSILLEGDIGEMHADLEREETDLSWSQYMETQVSTYLASKPELVDFSILLVECRTTACEIQAVGYGENANRTWFGATADLGEQSWAAEFNNGGGSTRPLGPGVTGILWIFQRRDVNSATNADPQLSSRS